MKLGTMLGDILKSTLKAPATQRYPFEKTAVPEQLRGKLLWNRDTCTGCGLCAKDCPSNAIEVLVFDKKARKFVFNYHADQCLFCGQCLFSCRQGSIQMPNDEWELAALTRQGYSESWGDEESVEAYLDGDLPE